MKTPYKLSENTFDHNEINAVKNQNLHMANM